MGELKKKLEIMYRRYGLTEEVIRLSQELDKYIIKEQRKKAEKWKS